MKLYIFLKVFLFSVFVCLACGTSGYRGKLYSEILEIYPNTDGKYMAYVLIRGPVCFECPDEINRFIANNAQKDNVLIIVYGSGDENALNEIIKYTDHTGNLVFFYPDNKIWSKENQYPEILYVSNNKIRKVEYQNEKNPFAFRKLEKRLAD